MRTDDFGIGSTREPPGEIAGDERAVSVAVNHVLAIGITTILITTLLFGAGNVLGQQSDRATQNQLRTIGDRLASQVTTAEAMAERRGGGVVLETNHPNNIVGSGYTVELVNGSDCPDVGARGCLRLTMVDDGTTTAIPVDVQVASPGLREEVSGGPIAIVYDANGARLAESSEDASIGAGVPAPDDQPAVGPIGGAVGETRTQPGSVGSATATASSTFTPTTTPGGGDPQLDITDITDRSGTQPGSDRARYTVSYSVTNGGNLGKVAIKFNNEDSTYVDWVNISDPPASNSVDYDRNGNPKGDGDQHKITIYVYDTDGNLVGKKCWVDEEADGAPGDNGSGFGTC
jgi:hypothetical protein